MSDPRPSSRPTTPGAPRGETRALVVSMVGSGVLGLGGVAWGAAVGSQIVLFDGVVTLAGIALVAVSMVAASATTSSRGSRSRATVGSSGYEHRARAPVVTSGRWVRRPSFSWDGGGARRLPSKP
jgi:hypothetical protein